MFSETTTVMSNVIINERLECVLASETAFEQVDLASQVLVCIDIMICTSHADSRSSRLSLALD